MTVQCPTPTAAGKPCKGRVPPGRVYCLSHDPERRDTIREAGRKGGEARANARRAVKAWAAIGREMHTDDLPAILQACALSVRDGEMTPGQASAIAAVLKTAVSISQAQELEERITALEEAAGVHVPANVRRLNA